MKKIAIVPIILVMIAVLALPGAVSAGGRPFSTELTGEAEVTVDGVPNPNLVWKDTILVPVGRTVDLLMEATNPGTWMMHCHIAEHLGAGMMGLFTVESG